MLPKTDTKYDKRSEAKEHDMQMYVSIRHHFHKCISVFLRNLLDISEEDKSDTMLPAVEVKEAK